LPAKDKTEAEVYKLFWNNAFGVLP
jgi:hypothetical protein